MGPRSSHIEVLVEDDKRCEYDNTSCNNNQNNNHNNFYIGKNMTAQSRYILELSGTPSISSNNNSIVNIGNAAGNGVPENVAVDLSKLGGGCAFDVNSYTVAGGGGGTYPVTNQNGCDSYDWYYIHWLDINISDIMENIYVTGATNHCHVIIHGKNCDDLIFSGNDAWGNYGNLNVVNKTPLQDIVFTCPSDQSINYNYTNFDVSFENNCFNTDKSYLIFTPKSTSTGTQHLGNSVNGDGSVNSPFAITHIDKQKGDFYIEPVCDTDGSSPILLSVLDNVVLG